MKLPKAKQKIKKFLSCLANNNFPRSGRVSCERDSVAVIAGEATHEII